MDRPHPPTPRRRALARDSGRVLTSPAWTASLALAAGTLAAIVAAPGIGRALAAHARTSLAHAADPDALARATAAATRLPTVALTAALPIALAAALGAVLGQAVVARGLWIPLRTVRGAPSDGAEPATVGGRLADATLGLVRAAILVATGALVVVAALPDLAALSSAAQLGAVAGSALATLAIAAVATSTLELVVRQRRLAGHLAMTDRELRDDARAVHGDPAIRRHRQHARDDDRAVVAGARVVIAGDALAVAIVWQAGDRPRPARIGRGLDARRVTAAARQARVPVVADAGLARALADAPAAVPDGSLAALAAVLAAVGVRS